VRDAGYETHGHRPGDRTGRIPGRRSTRQTAGNGEPVPGSPHAQLEDRGPDNPAIRHRGTPQRLWSNWNTAFAGSAIDILRPAAAPGALYGAAGRPSLLIAFLRGFNGGPYGQEFALRNAARGLVNTPLLALTSDDGLADHTDAFVAAVKAVGGNKVTTYHVATDHSWSDHRIALEATIITWLSALH